MNDETGGIRAWRRGGALIVVVAAATVLATACGGGSAPASVSGGTATFAQLVALAQCMRSHGVLNFPDPPRSARPPRHPLASTLSRRSSWPPFTPAALCCLLGCKFSCTYRQERTSHERDRRIDRTIAGVLASLAVTDLVYSRSLLVTGRLPIRVNVGEPRYYGGSRRPASM